MKLLVALCAALLIAFTNSASSRRRPNGVIDNPSCPKFYKKDCPLFSPKPYVVTASIFRNMILQNDWIGIYTIQIQQGNVPAFGKFRWKWTESGGVFSRILAAFDLRSSTCLNFDVEEILTEDECGIKLIQENPVYESNRFFSQDPTKYIWNDFCETPACDKGFFDLLIRDTRTGGETEIDLNQLPWHSIATDLKKLRGITMDDPTLRYAWVDDECPLH